MLWARGTTPGFLLAPDSVITSLRKYEIAFLDTTLLGFLGDTKRRRGQLTPPEVHLTYSQRQRTGHNSKSSSKLFAKSERDLTKKERGRGRKADSVLAKNSGTYDTVAPVEENETNQESACNSPTHLAVAKDKRKRTFLVKLRRDKSAKGSYVEERK